MQITIADIRPHVKRAVSLVIVDGHLNLPWGLCGYVWVNTLTLSPLRVQSYSTDEYIYTCTQIPIYCQCILLHALRCNRKQQWWKHPRNIWNALVAWCIVHGELQLSYKYYSCKNTSAVVSGYFQCLKHTNIYIFSKEIQSIRLVMMVCDVFCQMSHEVFVCSVTKLQSCRYDIGLFIMFCDGFCQ